MTQLIRLQCGRGMGYNMQCGCLRARPHDIKQQWQCKTHPVRFVVTSCTKHHQRQLHLDDKRTDGKQASTANRLHRTITPWRVSYTDSGGARRAVWYVPQVTRLIGCRATCRSGLRTGDGGGLKFIVGTINCDCYTK